LAFLFIPVTGLTVCRTVRHLKQIYEGALHVNTAGGGKGYTLPVFCTLLAVERDTPLHVPIDDRVDGYTLHIHLSIQQAGKRDTPSLSTLLAVARNVYCVKIFYCKGKVSNSKFILNEALAGLPYDPSGAFEKKSTARNTTFKYSFYSEFLFRGPLVTSGRTIEKRAGPTFETQNTQCNICTLLRI
jgi:hypothetical protein